jgi:hypothetical protein
LPSCSCKWKLCGCRTESEHYSSFTISYVRALSSDSDISLLSPMETFAMSRETELEGLRERGTFQVGPRYEVPAGARIYGTRFVDSLKGDGSKKSRLCVQAYNDKHHGLFVAAPTVKRSSCRLMLATCHEHLYKAKLVFAVECLLNHQQKCQLRRPMFYKYYVRCMDYPKVRCTGIKPTTIIIPLLRGWK